MNDLIQFCQTKRQREVLQAIESAGSLGKAAKALGISRDAVKQTVRLVKKYAAKHQP